MCYVPLYLPAQEKSRQNQNPSNKLTMHMNWSQFSINTEIYCILFVELNAALLFNR